MTTTHYKINETSFITNLPDIKMQLLKTEVIDRLESIVDDLPKYNQAFQKLIVCFNMDSTKYLIDAIYRDNDFKSSPYYKLYNQYLEEIIELTKSI